MDWTFSLNREYTVKLCQESVLRVIAWEGTSHPGPGHCVGSCLLLLHDSLWCRWVGVSTDTLCPCHTPKAPHLRNPSAQPSLDLATTSLWSFWHHTTRSSPALQQCPTPLVCLLTRVGSLATCTVVPTYSATVDSFCPGQSANIFTFQ